MRSISEIKKSSKNALNGYWGIVAISCLIYCFICLTISGIPIINVGALPCVFIGLNYQALNLCRGNNIKVEDMFLDIDKIIKVGLFYLCFTLYKILFVICLMILFFISLSINGTLGWTVLFIETVLATYIGIRLSLVNFIIIDNEDMSIRDKIKEAFKVTKNHCLKILLLDLSFIPLNILGILCLGIPFFWIIPYTLTTKAKLYLDIKEQSNNI